MKEEILKLRAEGKTYDQIKEILGCSKGTISYHCGEGQKTKTIERKKKNRADNPLLKKMESFKSKNFNSKTRDFQRNRKGGSHIDGREYNFEEKKVLLQLSKNPVCYLTGRDIDIFKPSSYHFDHIIPLSKGGDSSLKNLGLSCKEANMAKSDLVLEDFLNLCKEILEFNGYKVNRE